jgi:hypothetical protein
MPFTHDDLVVIQNHVVRDRWGARRLLREYPNRGWTRGGLDTRIRSIRQRGTIERLPGSGRPRTQRTDEKIQHVADVIIAAEHGTRDGASLRKIAMQIEASKETVQTILKEDLRAKNFRLKSVHELVERAQADREQRCVALLVRFLPDFLSFLFFTDESGFARGKRFYYVWGALEQLVYRRDVNRLDRDQFVQHLRDCWNRLSQESIDRAILKWLYRVRKVTEARGGHIEHYIEND